MRTCRGSPSLLGNTLPVAIPLFLQKAIPLLYTTGKETILAERIENMEYRNLGRTGWKISAIGFGAWGIGGSDWGSTDDTTSLAALHRAIDLGVNFIDTADVYGDGHSEQLIAQVRKARSEQLVIATKVGRRLNPHIAQGYTRIQPPSHFCGNNE